MNSSILYQFIDALGWALLHSIWQIAVFGLLVWVIFRFVSKDNAKLRYGVASISLAFIFISFILTLVHYLPGNNDTSINNTNISPELLMYLLVNSSEGISDFSNFNINQYFPIIVNIWIMGVCILSCHMTFSYLQTIKLRKHLTYPISEKTQKIASSLIKRFNINQKILFKESGYIQTPSLVGYFKPVILLPVSMLSGIPDNQLEIIIAHELAHIKRHDYLFQFIQGILELLFFYHPVVWWLSSVVNTEREHICDDLAVKVCGESLTLIKALNNMEAIRKKRFEMVLGLSGKKDNLFNRVQRIVRLKPESARRANKLVFSGLFVFLLSGLILISNFAISGNAFSGKQFFSKINIIDRNLTPDSNTNSTLALSDQEKKKKKKQSKKVKEVEEVAEIETTVEVVSEIEEVAEIETIVEVTPEVEVAPAVEIDPDFEVAPEIEVAPEVETEEVIEVPDVFDFNFPKDSLKSKEWLEKKVSEMIEEQKMELKEAVRELEEVKLEMNFEEMQKELQEELKDLNVEQLKKEFKEQEHELQERLKELSSKEYLKELQREQIEQNEELTRELLEIEKSRELNDKEKEEIKKRIKETLERVNSEEFQEQIKKSIERSQQSLKEHIQRMESGDFEEQMKAQREAIKKQLEKFQSSEYQKQFQENLKRSKESIQKHLEKLNTPEYRKELEERIKRESDQRKDSDDELLETLNTKMVDGRMTVVSNSGPVSFTSQYSKFPESTRGRSVFAEEQKMPGVFYAHNTLGGSYQIEDLQRNEKSEISDMVIVVDGKVIPREELKLIDPNSIDYIKVYKGKEAVDLYGKKAKNGAIVIHSINPNKPSSISMNLVGKPKNTLGLNPFSGKESPMYLLNGKQVKGVTLNELSPNDIENISVLKGESATELYGDKAKNGAILITSKGSSIHDSDNTFSGKDAPLIVIDGEIMADKSLKDLDPDQIKSITVLKNESAFEKYGEKGKNGAVEIYLIK